MGISNISLSSGSLAVSCRRAEETFILHENGVTVSLQDYARMKKIYWVLIYIREFKRKRRTSTKVNICIRLFINSDDNRFREGPTEY